MTEKTWEHVPGKPVPWWRRKKLWIFLPSFILFCVPSALVISEEIQIWSATRLLASKLSDIRKLSVLQQTEASLAISHEGQADQFSLFLGCSTEKSLLEVIDFEENDYSIQFEGTGISQEVIEEVQICYHPIDGFFIYDGPNDKTLIQKEHKIFLESKNNPSLRSYVSIEALSGAIQVGIY